MARIKVWLDIEELDLELLLHKNGVLLPTRVIRMREKEKDSGIFQLMHLKNKSGEQYAIPYEKSPMGDYPEDVHEPITAAMMPIYQEEDNDK